MTASALAEISATDLPVLERLLQLYQYDFSEIEGGAVDDHGVYGFVTLGAGYGHDADHHAVLFRVDGELGGFALFKPGAHEWPGVGCSVLDKYTGRRFEDTVVDGRPTQRFDNSR